MWNNLIHQVGLTTRLTRGQCEVQDVLPCHPDQVQGQHLDQDSGFHDRSHLYKLSEYVVFMYLCTS